MSSPAQACVRREFAATAKACGVAVKKREWPSMPSCVSDIFPERASTCRTGIPHAVPSVVAPVAQNLAMVRSAPAGIPGGAEPRHGSERTGWYPGRVRMDFSGGQFGGRPLHGFAEGPAVAPGMSKEAQAAMRKWHREFVGGLSGEHLPANAKSLLARCPEAPVVVHKPTSAEPTATLECEGAAYNLRGRLATSLVGAAIDAGRDVRVELDPEIAGAGLAEQLGRLRAPVAVAGFVPSPVPAKDLGWVARAVSKDSTRANLGLPRAEGGTVVAVDGSRLHVQRGGKDGGTGYVQVKGLKPNFNPESAMFPHWQDAVPSGDPTLEVDAGKFAAAVKRVEAGGKAPVCLTASENGRLTLTSQDPDRGESSATVIADVREPSERACFNGRYLRDALAGMKGQAHVRLVAGDLEPIRIESGKRAAVIMPMRA